MLRVTWKSWSRLELFLFGTIEILFEKKPYYLLFGRQATRNYILLQRQAILALQQAFDFYSQLWRFSLVSSKVDYGAERVNKHCIYMTKKDLKEPRN